MKGLINSRSVDNRDDLADKTFIHSLTVCVASILLCLILLSATTWAWFGDNISSASNSIQAGNCTVSVDVKNSGTNVEPQANTDSAYTFIFGAEKQYTVTITSMGTAKSSYCILIVDGKEYYTEQISTVSPDNSITFTMSFTNETPVQIITRWGTYHADNAARDIYGGKEYVDLKAAADT